MIAAPTGGRHHVGTAAAGEGPGWEAWQVSAASSLTNGTSPTTWTGPPVMSSRR